MNKKNLKISEEKRHLFSQPLDILIEGGRGESIPKVAQKFKELRNDGIQFIFYLVEDWLQRIF